MPRVHFVKKARKTIRGTGIKKGDSYYWWKFAYSARQVSKTRPTPQQLTRSDFQIQVYDIQDRIEALAAATPEDLQAELSAIADDIRALGEEQSDKLNNMPDSLQSGPTGELLQERADACETWADEIESIEVEEVDHDAVAARVRAEESDDIDIDAIIEEEYDREVAEAIAAHHEENRTGDNRRGSRSG